MKVLNSLEHRLSVHLLATLSLVLFPLAPSVIASGPEVNFDLGYVVECYDVTPHAFAVAHRDEKIVEADLRVSVRVEKGEEKDIQQLQFEITSPGKRLRVIDFWPRTQIEAEAAGHIEIVKTSETTRSVGATVGTLVSLSGGNSHVMGAVATSALPSGNATTTHRNELKETARKIPPGNAVVASGTLANEHGVFFKLRRSPAGTFEGIRPLSFRFVVPSQWRGDWLVISCRATGTVKRYFFKSTEEVGATKAFLALHLAGDTVAEQFGQGLAEAQEEYFAVEPLKDRDDTLIDTLATEAQRWRSSADLHTPVGVKAPVSCLTPVNLGRVLKFAVADKSATCETANRLRQTLECVARFSAPQGGAAMSKGSVTISPGALLDP